MKEGKFDYVIIINGLSTNFKDLNNELIELNWCTYDLNKKSVKSELGAFVRPKRLREISEDYLNQNFIKFSQLESSPDLQDVLKDFHTFIVENFTSKNSNFALLTKDDWLLGRQGQLVSEAREKNIKLGDHFNKYINLIREFKIYYNKSEDENPDLNDILKFYSLKRGTEVIRPTMQEVNTMVRIVNRMVKEGYQINSNKLISSGDVENLCEDNNIISDVQMMKEQDSLQINSPNISKKSPSKNNVSVNINKIPNNKPCFYIRVRNLPLYTDIQDIKEIFYMFYLLNEDIVVSYDIYKRKTGDFCFRLYNEENYKQILAVFNYRVINDKIIEVLPANEYDFHSCKLSSQIFNQDANITKGKVFLKVKNLPYSCREENIKQFFKNYYPSENGIKLFKNKKGNFLGEAVVSFYREEDTIKAFKEKNGENFMNQIITIETTSLEEFELYANTNGFYTTLKSLCEYVTPEVVTKSVFLTGLPLNVTKKDIINYLEFFNLNESNMIVDEKNMSNNGCLIITLLSEEDANYLRNYVGKTSFKFNGRERKITADPLLLLVNKGNES
jgi:RNA recognition motif-containing protein